MKEHMNSAVVSLAASGIRRVAERARELGCISLTLGEPSFDTPVSIREAAKRALDAGATHYPPNRGVGVLTEQIAAHESGNLGCAFGADQVLVTCGSTEALGCALFAVLEPGDEVIVPMPAFGLYAQQIAIARGVCVPLHTQDVGFQLTDGALEALVTPRTKAVLLNSPNNPAGTVYTAASLAAAADCCLRHSLFLIFDGVYDRFCYDGPMAYPDAATLGERLIYINAFSKTYAMTGWRVGYALAGHSVLPEMTKVHAALTVGVATFSQMGCVDIFSVPVDGMAAAYCENRDLVVTRLAKMGLSCVRPAGAFYAFPYIGGFGMNDEAFVDRLMAEHGVALVPGSCFGTPGFVRLSYCTDRETLDAGLARLAAFIRALQA